MGHLRNIELKNSGFMAKALWLDWPENMPNQLSVQNKMAGLAEQWPDLSKTSFLIAVFILKSLFPILFILSYRDRIVNSHLPMGHSIGQFVLDSHLAFKRQFYRTFSLLNSANSYLMVKFKNIVMQDINNCISMTCLFDGYLIEVHCRGYKTPKPLLQSGFFSPIPLRHRDNTKVYNPVHI